MISSYKGDTAVNWGMVSTKDNRYYILQIIVHCFGEMVWLHQFGSTGDDYMRKIILDSMNNIYACGYTYGQIGAEHFGNGDALLPIVFLWHGG